MESIDIKTNKLEENSEIHLLPCKIVYNGESDVKSFFSSSIMKSQTNNNNNDDNTDDQQHNFKIEG
jgi:hypothetical protein